MAHSQADGASSDRPLSMTTNQDEASAQAPSSQAPAELSAVVDELLNSLSSKFSTVSSELFARMDDMSKRLDVLEATVQHANAEGRESRDGRRSPVKS